MSCTLFASPSALTLHSVNPHSLHTAQPANRLTLTALVSRVRWLSALARHASGTDRVVLDARRTLAMRTMLRQAFTGGVSL